MRGALFAVLLSACFAQAEYFPLKLENIPEAAESYSLNGDWKVLPASGTLDAGEGVQEVVDGIAAAAAEKLASEGHAVAVPQMLNEIDWWLPISDRFVKADKERVKNLPFDAPNAEAVWYLREIDLPEIKGKAPEVHVDFEGIAMISRVYCNGNYVGGHLGMFGPAKCRLTPHLKWGQKNTLLVYVQRGKKSEEKGEVIDVAVTVPLTSDMLLSLNVGMFGGFGSKARATFMGIWQPVTLKVSQAGGRIADVFFNPTMQGHNIEVTLENPQEKGAVSGHVEYTVTDKKTGVLLASGKSDSVKVNAGETKVLNLKKDGLDPKLWEPDFPNLYVLSVDWVSGKKMDNYSCQVGYRTVEIEGNKIFLNGRPYYIRAANNPPYGYLPNDKVTAHAFLKGMHDGNTVVTRSHGNPWNDMWFTAADEEGVGVSAEGVRPWALLMKKPSDKLPPPAILKHWKEEQVETALRHRNHPSILFYCISNEPLGGLGKDDPKRHQLLKEVADAVREVDPSRPIFLMSGGVDYNNYGDLDDAHCYFGWYAPSGYTVDWGQRQHHREDIGLHRPLVSQEFAVPYFNTDTGNVLMPYAARWNADAWIGDLYKKPGGAAVYQEHVRAVAKRNAEKTRWQRRERNNNGYMLFNNQTWTKNVLSGDPSNWEPMSVYYAVQKADAPVLVAMENPQYVFVPGQTVQTRIFIVNDDERGRDLDGLVLTGGVKVDGKVLGKFERKLGDVAYYEVADFPIEFTMPQLAVSESERVQAELVFQVRDAAANPVTDNFYPVQFVGSEWAIPVKAEKTVALDETSAKTMGIVLKAAGAEMVSAKGARDVDVLVLNSLDGTTLDEALAKVKKGGRLIINQPQDSIDAFLGNEGLKTDDRPARKEGEQDFFQGEFVDLRWTGKNPLYDGLTRLDWKWWAQGSAAQAGVCDAVTMIKDNKRFATYGYYLSPYSYRPDNVLEKYRGAAVFVYRQDGKEVLVSHLCLNEALAHDPRAARTLVNFVWQPLQN